MHSSRVGSIVVDCEDLFAGVSFWSEALGTKPAEFFSPEDQYVSLSHTVGAVRFLLQRVPEPKSAKSRLHLDIETDDVASEVVRLESIGARRLRAQDGFRVLSDVCGNEFCVVPPETPSFPERAIMWGPHQSRVGSIGIDCDDLAAGVAFWSAALGLEPAAEDGGYVDLRGDVGGLRVFLQRVPEPKSAKSRIHLDIETDDVEAEVARLVALGARRGGAPVLYDPCGNEFCVIEPETPGFPERAMTWCP